MLLRLTLPCLHSHLALLTFTLALALTLAWLTLLQDQWATTTVSLEVIDAYDPSEYDFTVNVEAYADSIEVGFNYWTDQISTEQTRHIAETFSAIVNSIIGSTSASKTIGEIDLCSDNERKQIMKWNEKPPPLVDCRVHDLIYRQSQSLPMTAQAICSWDADLTYIKLKRGTPFFFDGCRTTCITPACPVLCFMIPSLNDVVLENSQQVLLMSDTILLS